MSIRHLDSLFHPRSVAVFGASDRPGSVGATVWRNLCEGGFPGALYAVNPRHEQVGGQRAWRDVAALPEAPELAVICTPPASVPGLVESLGARGTRAAIVLTAGLSDKQRQTMLDAARRHLRGPAIPARASLQPRGQSARRLPLGAQMARLSHPAPRRKNAHSARHSRWAGRWQKPVF